jgi:hypothetical protein
MMKLPATQQMMKLPATLKEAEALALARERKARFTEGNPFSEHSALSPEASRAFCADLMKPMLQSAEGRMWLVAAAKAGEPYPVDLLQAVRLECKSRNLEMTTELKEYDLWVTLHGERRRRRSEATSYPVRDICMALTVAEIIDRYDFKPTGSSARFRSACSIVAEAWGMSYNTVLTVWQRHERHMPTVPGWASK